jgi:hypothetical protein
VNLDLHTSVRVMLGKDERVSLWGPFELRPGVYRKFLMQRQFVESGRMGYQCVDVVGESARCGNGYNCIHAITDADAMFGRARYMITDFGEDASADIVAELTARGALVNAEQTHDWLIGALGLGRYPIVRRSGRLPAPPCPTSW